MYNIYIRASSLKWLEVRAEGEGQLRKRRAQGKGRKVSENEFRNIEREAGKELKGKAFWPL